LLPRPNGRGYELWDPADGQRTRVDDAVAATISRNAIQPTAPLDEAGEPTMAGVTRFAFRNARRGGLVVLGAAAATAALGVLTPLLTGHIFGALVPERETSLVLVAGLALAVSALLVGALTVVQGLAVSRATIRAQQRLQSAVWDRLLSLPALFFRSERSGATATRVLALESLQDAVSISSVTTVLAAVFTVVNLAVAFLYAPLPALIATVQVVAVAGITWWYARRVVAATRPIVAQDRANAAMLNDVLRALPKIRGARAEDRFFALYLDAIRTRIALGTKQWNAASHLMVLLTSVGVLLTGTTFVVIGAFGWDDATGRADISPATFIAFTTAFNAVLAAILGLSNLIGPLAAAGPTIAALGPLTSTPPEHTAVRKHPGVLRGKIELRNIDFRYAGAERLVLDDVSFEVLPGEFVALVGPSGAGKSSILRLVLGFEHPTGGVLYYDDQPADHVDMDAVRRQFGVVLQASRVVPGSILDNLVGAGPIDLEAVWAALAAAALDDDVKALPMGLHTMVTPDSTTFSGGQVQRLLIAKALLRKPRILILDEATSSLDDVTQDVVSESLAGLHVTRLVVAHRLSTIRSADRVVVLDGGRVVENGGFDELIAAGGLFSRLVQRQTA
jgi:ABC-type bacteriocin/lantibiotic exporter with double-glycine peptidase domain